MPFADNVPGKKEDTLKKRYSYKLFANSVNFMFNLIIQAIIPRGLGPEAYGSYHFLTNFFSQITGFSDMGFSTCFYTRLSQRPKEEGIVSFYFIFMATVTVFISSFAVAAGVFGLNTVIWPGQKMFFVYSALGVAGIMWLANTLNFMTDAYGLTVNAEMLKVFQKITGFFVIALLYFTNYLKLGVFFAYNYAIWILLGCSFIILIYRKKYLTIAVLTFSAERIKEYAKEFWKYSNPLFVYSLIGLAAGLFDRWILQIYGGGIQQGFYSLSYQIGAICFIFTGSMTPLFMRELSIAHNKNDIDSMRRTFRRYVPVLYAITAYFACFIAASADKVVYIFGGNAFKGAAIVVAIMAFYPLHQTYGQLSSSVFYAMSHTKTYRNIAVFFVLIGLPITYFLIAPQNRMGINAGALGLSIKMVVLNIISTNTMLYFNARQLGLRYWKYAVHQVATACALLVLSLYLNKVIGLLFFRYSIGDIPVFLITGMFYTVFSAGLFYFCPRILGMERSDISYFVGRLKQKLRVS